MKILLTTMNAKYIHKNLALRWIFQACPNKEHVILKEYTLKEDLEVMVKDILSMKIDVLAFSTYIWNIEQFLTLVQMLKKAQPSLHIIAGGPEVSFESYGLLEQGIDALSIGEGEESIWEYVAMLEQQKSKEIVGMYSKQFPNTVYRKVSLSFLESLPNPYFMEQDFASLDKQYLYFETSRGCPYHCAYCLSSVDTCVRMFSEPYVFQLLKEISMSKVRQVKLLDRTFNSNPKRALKIARYMNEHCPNQVFQFEVVAETLSDELLNFFCKEADKQRFRLEIGVQSFHSKTLEAVGRIQNNQRLKEVIFALRDANVMMHVDLIAGLPYEDYTTFQTSFDTLFDFQVKEIQLGILKLLKGTKLRQQKAEYAFEEEIQAPYTIQETRWLTKDELVCIEGAASACEKFYNSGKCRNIILEILQQGWITSPFTCFVELGKIYQKFPHPYPVQNLYRVFLSLLKHVDQRTLKGIISFEYYSHFKQRPPRLWKDEVSLELKKELFQILIQKEIVSKEQLYHYGVADLAYLDKELGYQVIVFQRDNTYPKRYFITLDDRNIKEIN